MPGVTTRNRLENSLFCGVAALLSVCQAMSIAITTVLPEPVAIFSATPVQAVVVLGVRVGKVVADPDVAGARRHLGQVDRRLRGLALAEQHPVLPLRVRPVLQQPACRRRDVAVARVAPDRDVLADPVDQIVALDLVGGQLGQFELSRALAELALDADEAELTVRRDLLARCARRLRWAAVDADIVAVQRVWAALSALTGELADDPDAAEIVDGGAEYLIATQVHERGTGRLAQLRVTLRSANVKSPVRVSCGFTPAERRGSTGMDAVCPQYRGRSARRGDQRARCRRCWSTSRAAVATLTGGGVPRRSALAQVEQTVRHSTPRPVVTVATVRPGASSPQHSQRAPRGHQDVSVASAGMVARIRHSAYSCGVLCRFTVFCVLEDPAVACVALRSCACPTTVC